MITGSAPIKKDVFEFMKIIMSCPFYEGYGQTENTAAAFINNSKDPLAGHVGGVVVTIMLFRAPCSSSLMTSSRCTIPAKTRTKMEDLAQEVKYGCEDLLFLWGTTKISKKLTRLLLLMDGSGQGMSE